MNYLFDKKWFAKRQRILLFLCNNFILKYWFRYILRIYKDCSFNEKIVRISPNHYDVYLGMFLIDGKLQHRFRGDFRTHNKFSKRIKYSFYPFWWLAHQWDMLVANNFCPALNLGFDTLTVYPDAGTGNTTVDGRVTEDGEGSWSSIRDAGGDASADTIETGNFQTIISHGNTSSSWFRIGRTIYTFDTSAITASGILSSVVVSFYGNGKADNTGWYGANNIYSASPASNNALVAGDYDSLGTSPYCDNSIAYADWANAYNNFTLNATGKSAVNKIGITKIGGRESLYDAPNSSPSVAGGSDNYSQCSVWFSDRAGLTQDPKLVAVYSLPSVGFIQSCII